MIGTYEIAIFCGAFPAILGTAIFLAWVIAPLLRFQIAGIFLILIGAMLFAIGFVSLWFHARLARRASVSRRKPIRRAAALLIVNLPLCVFYVFVATAVSSVDFVLIRNAAATPIENLILTDSSGNAFAFRPTPPGQTHIACFRIRGEGALKYSFAIGHQRRSGYLSGYIGLGGTHFELHLSEKLEVRFENRSTQIR